MHDPAGTLALGSTASVENQRLLHPNQSRVIRNRLELAGLNCAVLAGCLPVASICGSVGAMTVRVLPITWAEEEPFLIV